MWLYFNQTIWRTVACMLLYQASGLIIDYVTIIVASKCFSNITMDSLHESMVNVLLGVLRKEFRHQGYMVETVKVITECL